MPLCCLRIQRSFFIDSDNETTDQEDVEVQDVETKHSSPGAANRGNGISPSSKRVKIGPKGKQSSTNNDWTSAVQENFKSVDPASARFRVIGSLNPKYLKWGSKKPRSAKSEMRIRGRYVELDSGASRKPSNPIADYCDSLEQETGRRKDAVAPKVLNSRKEKAMSYLENKGWKTTIGLKKLYWLV